MIAFWIVCGGLFTPLAFVVIPLSVLLLKRRGMHSDIILGFFVLLVLSDSRQNIFAFAASVKDVYALLLGVLLFVDSANFKPLDSIAKRFVVFLVFAVFSLVFSEVFMTNIAKTTSYMIIFLVVPNFTIRAYKEEGNRFIRDLVMVGTMLLVAGLIIRFINADFVTLKGRYNGVLGNPNGLGLFSMLFIMLVGIVMEYFPGILKRVELVIVILVILASLYLCGSRTSLFAVMIFFVFRSLYRISPALGFILFLGLVFFYYIISSNIEAIIIALNLQDYFRIDTFETGSGRVIAWQFGWDEIAKEPLMGKGIGYTDYLYKKNYAFLSSLGHQGNAHNSYITFWLDTGIFGLVSFLVAFVVSFVKGAINSRSAIPALYAILFSAFFESWLTASLNPFTIQMLIILTILTSPVFNEKEEEETETENQEDVTTEAADPVH